MSKGDFARTVIGKVKGAIGTDGGGYGAGSASAAMAAVAQGITEYLLANTEVTVSYSGIIPGTPPMPDPVVIDTFKIVGACAPTGPANSFDAWIRQIEANIIAGFTLAPMGQMGVSFVTPPFLNPGISVSQADLKSAHNIGDSDPQQKIWEIVCGGIMDWINGGAMNTVAGMAARASAGSSGSAVILKIRLL